MQSEKAAVTVRPATLEDAPALAGALTTIGIFEKILPAGEKARAARVAENLERLIGVPGHDILVADIDGRCAAGYLNMHCQPCLTLDGAEGFISELFIHADCQGMGVGSALLAEAERLARERGWWRLHLVNHRERESYRRGFYAAHGWQERAPMADFVLLLKG
jgi:GNAT superfamily N-acetyltransferase